MTEHIGRQLGNYRLTQLLGRGGFADTYLGEQIYLRTLAAIKVLQAQLAQEDKESFFQEARTIARLRHPNIVRVLEFSVEEQGNIPYLVMDYAPNGTLRRRHPRGTPLPPEVIVPYVKQIAEALQFAHDQKIVHRDVKPENMLLGHNMEVLLSDFGIAIIAQNTRAQSVQDVAGTMTYMAPEQIQGRPRPASDQYALAVVIYEWLCGVVPFSGTYTEVAIQHERTNPASLRSRIPSLSQDINHVIMTALSKDPAHRFGSVRAFANAFEQATLDARAHSASPQPSAADAQIFMATEISSSAHPNPAPALPEGPQVPQTFYGNQAQPAQPPAAASELYRPQYTPTPPIQQPAFQSQPPSADPNPYGTQPAPASNQNPYGTLPAPSAQNAYGPQQTPSGSNPYGGLAIPASQPPYREQPAANTPSFYGSSPAQLPYQPQQTPAGPTPYVPPQQVSNPGLYGAVPQPVQQPPVGQSAYGLQNSLPLATPVRPPLYQQASGIQPGLLGSTGAPTPPVAPKRFNLGTRALIIILVAALIIGSIAIFFTAVYIPNQQHAQATSTAVTQITGTVSANNTATSVANATATGAVVATTAAIASATAYPTNLLTQSTAGKPNLADPLTTPDGNDWDHFTNDSGGCNFTGGGYHAIAAKDFFTPCFAKVTKYKDMAFEVEMTIISGHNGGLVFHTDTNGSGYYFRISTDGTYNFAGKAVDSQNNATTTELISGTSDLIKSSGVPNTLAIVDKGGDIFLYLNGTYLNRIHDTAYTSGSVGVFADSDTQSAEAVFRNLKIWQL